MPTQRINERLGISDLPVIPAKTYKTRHLSGFSRFFLLYYLTLSARRRTTGLAARCSAGRDRVGIYGQTNIAGQDGPARPKGLNRR